MWERHLSPLPITRKIRLGILLIVRAPFSYLVVNANKLQVPCSKQCLHTRSPNKRDNTMANSCGLETKQNLAWSSFSFSFLKICPDFKQGETMAALKQALRYLSLLHLLYLPQLINLKQIVNICIKEKAKFIGYSRAEIRIFWKHWVSQAF